MKIAQVLLFFLGVAQCAAPIASASTLLQVSTVVPDANGDPSITGAPHGSDTTIYASGYFNIGDSGAGYFTQTGLHNCKFTTMGTPNASSTTVNSVGTTVGVTRGAFISGSGIPAGDTVVSFTANTIWLAIAATSGGSSVPLTIGGSSGVDGSSMIADSVGNCFARTSAFTGNVRESGALCDVQVFGAPDNASYNPVNGNQLTITLGTPQPVPGD